MSPEGRAEYKRAIQSLSDTGIVTTWLPSATCIVGTMGFCGAAGIGRGRLTGTGVCFLTTEGTGFTAIGTGPWTLNGCGFGGGATALLAGPFWGARLLT